MSEKLDMGNEGVEPRRRDLYTRVSAEGQRDVATLDEQKAALLRFAEEAGYEVVDQDVDGDLDTDC